VPLLQVHMVVMHILVLSLPTTGLDYYPTGYYLGTVLF
jgi:hypothetical protein